MLYWQGGIHFVQVLHSHCWDLLCLNSSPAIAAGVRSTRKVLILQHYSGATRHKRRCLEAFCLNVSCRHFYISMLNHAVCMMGEFYDLMCLHGPSPWKKTQVPPPSDPQTYLEFSCLHMTLVLICACMCYCRSSKEQIPRWNVQKIYQKKFQWKKMRRKSGKVGRDVSP